MRSSSSHGHGVAYVSYVARLVILEVGVRRDRGCRAPTPHRRTTSSSLRLGPLPEGYKIVIRCALIDRRVRTCSGMEAVASPRVCRCRARSGAWRQFGVSMPTRKFSASWRKEDVGVHRCEGYRASEVRPIHEKEVVNEEGERKRLLWVRVTAKGTVRRGCRSRPFVARRGQHASCQCIRAAARAQPAHAGAKRTRGSGFLIERMHV